MNNALCIEAEYQHQRLIVEFIEFEERVGSANLRFEFKSNSARQELTYIRTASWVAYEAIDQFVKSLGKGNFSALNDLSDYPILEIQRFENDYWLTINPHDERESREAKEIRLEILLGSLFPPEIMRSYKRVPQMVVKHLAMRSKRSLRSLGPAKSAP
jgi:hypothetical protein